MFDFYVMDHGQLGGNSTCLVSRITVQVPYQDFKFPISALIGTFDAALGQWTGSRTLCG
jgi:hypothetical protein